MSDYICEKCGNECVTGKIFIPIELHEERDLEDLKLTAHSDDIISTVSVCCCANYYKKEDGL